MDTNPFAPPKATVADVEQPNDLEYVGFWMRVGAALIDTVLIMLVTYPLLYMLYGAGYFSDGQKGRLAGGADFVITWVFPIVVTVVFWLKRQATPGKLAIGARVVDAKTGNAISTGQAIGRYAGYFLSTVVFGLGFIWIAFDARKRGWHDRLAGTVVVRSRRGTTEPVSFENR